MAAWSAFDGAFKLAHRRRLGIELLLGDHLRLPQRLVARQVHLGVVELRLVARQLSLRLLQLHLERPRIDLGQQVALA